MHLELSPSQTADVTNSILIANGVLEMVLQCWPQLDTADFYMLCRIITDKQVDIDGMCGICIATDR